MPKRSLTGDATARVDTRVLQRLYSFDRDDLPVYVGQQMDVFIETPPLETDAVQMRTPQGSKPGGRRGEL
ncbi:MAG: hypothetical protein ACRERE_22195 [Candidatus Entotheonellia bacterium]